MREYITIGLSLIIICSKSYNYVITASKLMEQIEINEK